MFFQWLATERDKPEVVSHVSDRLVTTLQGCFSYHRLVNNGLHYIETDGSNRYSTEQGLDDNPESFNQKISDHDSAENVKPNANEVCSKQTDGGADRTGGSQSNCPNHSMSAEHCNGDKLEACLNGSEQTSDVKSCGDQEGNKEAHFVFHLVAMETTEVKNEAAGKGGSEILQAVAKKVCGLLEIFLLNKKTVTFEL